MRYIILFVVSSLILTACASGVSTSSNTNQGDRQYPPAQNNNINMSDQTGSQNTNSQLSGTTPEPEVGTPVNQYALSDVAKHGTASDCWLAANAKVYNVTSFVDKHPGGDKILQGCDKDMTEFFNTKHLKQSKEKLPEFYIGDLK